jgi:hypothetical protein
MVFPADRGRRVRWRVNVGRAGPRQRTTTRLCRDLGRHMPGRSMFASCHAGATQQPGSASRADQHRIAFGFRSLERLSLPACARLPFTCGVRRIPCGQVRPLGLHRYRRRGRWRRPCRASRHGEIRASPTVCWPTRLVILGFGGFVSTAVAAGLEGVCGRGSSRTLATSNSAMKRTDCAEIGKEGQGLRSLLTGSRKPRSNACACGGSRARQAATAADRRGSIRTPGASSSIGDYPENAREKPAAPNRRSPNLCHGPVRPYRRRRDLYGSTSLLRIA